MVWEASTATTTPSKQVTRSWIFRATGECCMQQRRRVSWWIGPHRRVGIPLLRVSDSSHSLPGRAATLIRQGKEEAGWLHERRPAEMHIFAVVVVLVVLKHLILIPKSIYSDLTLPFLLKKNFENQQNLAWHRANLAGNWFLSLLNVGTICQEWFSYMFPCIWKSKKSVCLRPNSMSTVRRALLPYLREEGDED